MMYGKTRFSNIFIRFSFFPLLHSLNNEKEKALFWGQFFERDFDGFTRYEDL